MHSGLMHSGPMQLPGIVAEPEDVDARWLTAVLQYSGIDAEITGFTTREIGTGQVGRNIRFTLDYSRGTGPASIVGKFASQDPTSRATGVAQNNYFKEVMFYNTILPSVGIRAPRPLYADIDATTHAFCLMLEDITPAAQGDQLTGCTVEMAALAMAQAAKLHAPRWNDPQLDEITWLQPNAALGPDFFKSFWHQLFPGFMARYHDRLPQEHRDLLHRFSSKLDGWVMQRSGPRSLVHGDFRLDNMLYGSPQGSTIPLVVVDWQTISIGKPISDIAYFLGAGLLPDVRGSHEVQLLRVYHEALLAQGVANFSFEACFRDYRRFSFSGLVMAVIASMLVVRTTRGDDMFMAMANRHAQQALELDAEALLAIES